MEAFNLYHSEIGPRKHQELSSTPVNIILYDPDTRFFYSVVKQSTPGLLFVLFEYVCFTRACRSSA